MNDIFVKMIEICDLHRDKDLTFYSKSCGEDEFTLGYKFTVNDKQYGSYIKHKNRDLNEVTGEVFEWIERVLAAVYEAEKGYR